MRCSFIYILIFVLVGCTSEKRDDCFTSLGKVVSVSRIVSAEFNKLIVSDRIELTLYQDSTKAGELIIRAPEGVIDQVSSEVSEATLRLKNENTCNFVRSYDYQISISLYVKSLDEITTESIASITTPDTLFIGDLVYHNYALSDNYLLISGNSILLESFNSSTTKLSGAVATLRGSVEEISELDAAGLMVEEVILDTHTPFDTYINALKGIYVKIYNSGNILYTTEPSDYKVVAERTGTGRLIKK